MPDDRKYELHDRTVAAAEAYMAEAVRIVEAQPPFNKWRDLNGEERIAYTIAVSAVFRELMTHG